MPLITADHIFSPSGWLKNHVLEISDKGEVIDLKKNEPGKRVQNLGEYLIPGLINAHTHLELSHLKYEIPEGTGMAGFAWEVVKSRGKEKDLPLFKLQKSMERAVNWAWEAGVQGFGDIANEESSAELKQRWKDELHFHTFVELIGLNGKMAATIMERGRALMEKFDRASLSLHAPYSVSPRLRDLVYETGGPFSIHLLESKEEKEVFEKGKGAMVDFFFRLGLDFIGMEASDPQRYLLEGFPENNRTLWVHLKEASSGQLRELAAMPNSWFCLCPRSNVYIHGDGPEMRKFLPWSDRICLGTDSLASNYDLNVWEEVIWLRKRYPELSFHSLVKWATFNGAKALGFEKLGEFSKGNTPGVLAVDGMKCQRLF